MFLLDSGKVVSQELFEFCFIDPAILMGIGKFEKSFPNASLEKCLNASSENCPAMANTPAAEEAPAAAQPAETNIRNREIPSTIDESTRYSPQNQIEAGIPGFYNREIRSFEAYARHSCLVLITHCEENF